MKVSFGPKVRESPHQWLDLIKQYWAILLVVFIAAITIVLMPVVGYVLNFIRFYCSFLYSNSNSNAIRMETHNLVTNSVAAQWVDVGKPFDAS